MATKNVSFTIDEDVIDRLAEYAEKKSQETGIKVSLSAAANSILKQVLTGKNGGKDGK